ncbi:MAG TPA: hypothetical protein VE974_02785 [Thermoanaerobaculia bacterium]|nr:hypothetical protein [Thermoanaerobaculia bacterium]
MHRLGRGIAIVGGGAVLLWLALSAAIDKFGHVGALLRLLPKPAEQFVDSPDGTLFLVLIAAVCISWAIRHPVSPAAEAGPAVTVQWIGDTPDGDLKPLRIHNDSDIVAYKVTGIIQLDERYAIRIDPIERVPPRGYVDVTPILDFDGPVRQAKNASEIPLFLRQKVKAVSPLHVAIRRDLRFTKQLQTGDFFSDREPDLRVSFPVTCYEPTLKWRYTRNHVFEYVAADPQITIRLVGEQPAPTPAPHARSMK